MLPFIINLASLLLSGVFDYSVPIALLLLIVGFILTCSLEKTNNNLISTLLVFVVLGTIFLLGFRGNFDKGIFYPEGLELNTISNHRTYYIQNFSGSAGATLFAVRIGRALEIINRIIGNLFSQLRFTNFFDFKNILSLPLLSLFTIGLVQLFAKPKKSVIVYFLIVMAMNALLIDGSKLGFFMYIPLVSFIVYLGLSRLIRSVKK